VKKLVKMDGAFPYMDDLSEKEISDRLESLFDSSLPSLDSPSLQETAASILESTSATSEVLGQHDNATDADELFGARNPGSNAQATPTTGATTFSLSTRPAIKTTSGGSATVAVSTSSLASVTASSSTSGSSATSSKQSLNALKASIVAAATAVTAAGGAPQSSIQNIILSPQPVMNMSTGLGKLLTSSTTPTVIQQGGIQYTLQPAPASVTSAAAQVTAAGLTATQVNGALGQLTSIGAKTLTQKSKAQPQLLPKPASNSSLISTVSAVTSGVVMSPAISTVVSMANAQRPVVTMAQHPGSSQQFVLNTSGVITGASQAPLLLTGQPNQLGQHILIQQPGGNPILVMQPSAPQTQTIMPTMISTSTGQGTILLQSSAGGPPTAAQAAATGMIAGPQQSQMGQMTTTPQIKIITPQGRMQMQQIQTPSGPKLIAVPVNVGQAAGGQQAGQPITTAVVQQPSASPGGSHDKKSKKKAARAAAAAAAAAALQQAQTDSNKSGLDLGELMKDVGLDDLDGYNNSNESSNAGIVTTLNNSNVLQQNTANNSNVLQQNTTTIISSQGQTIMQSAPTLMTTTAGNQILVQNQPQQIQVQPAASNQYQLIQGPDGQIMLQQSAPAQTILTQQGLNLGSTPLLTASGNLIGAAQPVCSLSGLSSLSSPSAINTTVIGQPASTTVVVSSVATSTTTAQGVSGVSGLSPPKKSRIPPDPNRVPKYHDERLPAGWHRKVSQRKSGASAGRFEVFIIGPTGKRFRSRNELKAFFEKTGETVLQPEHFDFSTFGTNTVNLPKEYQAKNKNTTSNPTIIAAASSPAVSQDPGMPKLTPMAGPSTNANPQYKSQLSLETAEADATISSLLDSLKKDSSSSSKFQNIDAEKMSELFQISSSLTGGDDNSCDSQPPPSIVKGASMISSLTTPIQVSIPTTTTSIDMKSPVLTSGTSGFQSIFLNSLSGTPEKNPKGLNLDSPSASTASLASTNASSLGSSTSIGPNAVTMGGSSTQRRALQNLPQNTKVVRGPNGQYSLQKIQTIELTVEQQNNLRLVQTRISEIELKPTKSAKDENELAQLHSKQQQILASGRHIPTQNIQEQVSLTTATSVVSSLNTSSTISIVPPVSKSIPVPNVTVTKLGSAPIRYTHTVGNQVISIPPSGTSGTTTTTATSTIASTPATAPTPGTLTPVAPGAPPAGAQAAAAAAQTAAAITQLTDEQKRIVFEFKQKMAQLPPDQQPAFIAQHKGSLLKQLNFQPTQLQLLRNNHIQLQLSRPQVRTLPPTGVVVQGQQTSQQQQQNGQQRRPLPIGAGTIRQPNESDNNTPNILQTAPSPSGGTSTLTLTPGVAGVVAPPSNRHKNVAWIENQIRKDQHEAVNPKYKLPFKSKDDAIKRLLRYHVFYDVDSSREEMIKNENDFEAKSEELLDKSKTMLNRYHYLLTQESKREVSSSEEVMLARLWDSSERQTLKAEKEQMEAGCYIDVPLLNPDQREKYSNYKSINNSPNIANNSPNISNNSQNEEQTENNQRKRKRSGTPSDENNAKGKVARGDNNTEMYDSINSMLNANADTEDSDDEFTLKDVVDKNVGSILDAATSADDEDDDDEVDDDVLQMSGTDADVVAAAFGTETVLAINSILDTLPQGDRIETPDINNITGLFDSIEDETAAERDPMTEAAVNSIPQF